MKKTTFRPMVETLEDRVVLASGGGMGFSPALVPVVQPTIQVINWPMDAPVILPGASDVPIAKMKIVATRGVARFEELLCVPPFQSEWLAQNTHGFTLNADLDGKPGYETALAYAFADWKTDVVGFNISRPVWVGDVPLKIQVTARVNTYLSPGSIGLMVGQAIFRDLRNEVIPDTQVSYLGADPILHPMENHIFSIGQVLMDADVANINVGQKNVVLLESYAWTNTKAAVSMMFIAAQGSLDNVENFRLVHLNWDGVQDTLISGWAFSSFVGFDFTLPAYQGGKWQVLGDIKLGRTFTVAQPLQLAFAPSSLAATAFDLEKNQRMQGFMRNGIVNDDHGAQVQLWAQESYATKYMIQPGLPAIVAALDGSSPLNSAVAGNQMVVAAKYKFTASNDNYNIKELVIMVDPAVAIVINFVSLWDGAERLAVAPYDVVNQGIYFHGLDFPVAANTSKVLTVALDLATPYTDGNIVTTGVNAKVTMPGFVAANSQGTWSNYQANLSGNDLYVYKSLPTLTTLDIPDQGTNLSAGATTSLYKFDVAADAKGDVAIKQVTFSVGIPDKAGAQASLDTFKLFRGKTDITNEVHIQSTSGTSLEGSTEVLGSTTVVVTFDWEQIVSAGSHCDFTLTALPHNFFAGDSVTTRLLSDSTALDGIGSTTSAYLAGNSGTAVQYLDLKDGHPATWANLIWSDNSAVAHSDSTGDWFNSFGLLDLPLSALKIVAL